MTLHLANLTIHTLEPCDKRTARTHSRNALANRPRFNFWGI